MSTEIELIERTFRAYFTVFQMGEPRAITTYYDVPCLFVSSNGGSHAVTSGREAEQFFERSIYALRLRGYSRSVLTHVQIKQMAVDLALINARAERFQRDGELLERISALYTMRKATGTWRIATVAMYDPEQALDLL
jgi:hypothetical protein